LVAVFVGESVACTLQLGQQQILATVIHNKEIEPATKNHRRVACRGIDKMAPEPKSHHVLEAELSSTDAKVREIAEYSRPKVFFRVDGLGHGSGSHLFPREA
jgi:hypothetical protein